MRDANENILKVIVNNVHESVEFLEKFVEACAAESLYKPTNECFQYNRESQSSQEQNTTTTTSTTTTANAASGGVFSFEWEKSEMIPLNDIKNMVCFFPFNNLTI